MSTSDERYRTLLESINDSVVILDRELRCVLVNEAASRFTGIPREELLGAKLTEQFPDIEETSFFKTLKRVMDTRIADRVVDEYSFPDGRTGWYEVHVYPVPEGILCISRDVTDRKRMEERLKESMSYIQALYYNAPDSILFINPEDYTIASANKAAAEKSNMNMDEMVGMPCYKVTHNLTSPCEPPEHACPISEMMETGKRITVEHTHYDKDGNPRFEEVYVDPMRDDDGKIVQMVHFARDITERKRMEEELRLSEAEKKVILDAIPDAITLKDRNFKSQWMNDSYVKLFDSDKESLMSTCCYNDLFERQEPHENCPVKNVYDTGKSDSGIINLADGRTLEVRANPIQDDSGDVTAVIEVIRDITERKKLEEERDEAFKKGTIFASRDVRNKIIMAYQAAHLSEQGGLEQEEAFNSVKSNLKAAMDVLDNLLFGLEKTE